MGKSLQQGITLPKICLRGVPPAQVSGPSSDAQSWAGAGIPARAERHLQSSPDAVPGLWMSHCLHCSHTAGSRGRAVSLHSPLSIRELPNAQTHSTQVKQVSFLLAKHELLLNIRRIFLLRLIQTSSRLNQFSCFPMSDVGLYLMSFVLSAQTVPCFLKASLVLTWQTFIF